MRHYLQLIPVLALLLAMNAAYGQNTRDWSIVASYTIPGKASGLAWDGQYLYSGLYSAPGDDNLIYQIDPSDGSYTLYCAGPFDKAYGLTHDGTNLWTTDRTGSYTPAIAVEFDGGGNLLSTFDLPATYHSGIEYDNGDFWVCCYYNPDGMVYKLDGQGNILTQFASPNEQPWAICKENDNLWIADYNANMLYKIDQSGNLLESHPSENTRPAGVVFDGTYLWYCDGGLQVNSTLYKVDLAGTGTPQMNIPVTSHQYGNVTVGTSQTWQMQVQNTGTADLTITGLNIPSGQPISSTFNPPQVISPGNSINIPLTYSPVDAVPLNTSVTVTSDDPVNPNETVSLTGHGVWAGPYISASASSHDFGLVRIGAHKRWFLEITNLGNQVLNISNIITGTNNFYIGESSTFPLSVATLNTVKIGIWFNPPGDGVYLDTVIISSNDPGQDPLEITVEGAGLDNQYAMGDPLWYYFVSGDNYDNSPKAIAPIEDITGDKVNDVILCAEDDFVYCLNGNSHNEADVMWSHLIYSGSVYNQNGLYIIEDVDGDSFDDVIVGTAWGDRSVVALSGKTGNQIWKYQTNVYGDGGWVYQVHAKFDYNGDGIADVLASSGDDSNDNGPKRIHCLDGTDGSVIWETYTGGPNFSVIGVEDFNGDGQPDVVAGASNAQETQGRVYGLNGINGAIQWTHIGAGTSFFALEQLDDINGDGVADIVAGDFGGNIYLLDATDGSVMHTTGVGNELVLRFDILDDVNNDGYSDVVIAHSGTNGVVISGLDGSTIWFQPLADKSWNVAKTNDLDFDGINDVLIGTLYQSNFAYFLDGTTGEELESKHYSEPIDALNSIPDIVGDGTWEMVVGGREGTVYCYSGGYDPSVGLPETVKEQGPVSVFPNPFREMTGISITLEREKRVELDIYNLYGQHVSSLASGNYSAGPHTFYWNGGEGRFTPGIYLYRFRSGNEVYSGKLNLMK